MIQKVMYFLDETLWRMELSEHSKWFRILIHPLRFLVLTAKAAIRDGSILHASALTYITMLAIVPILALTLTTLKAFGAGDLAEKRMKEQIVRFVGQMDDYEMHPTSTTSISPAPAQDANAPDLVNSGSYITAQEQSDANRAANALISLCDSVFEQINKINFAKMGVVGAVVLICMVISVLSKVESSFNTIWGIKKGRTLWRKFSDYLSLLIIMPMLILAASSIPILETIAKATGLHLTILENLGIFNAIVPFLIGTILLAFLFGFLPNTHVRLSSAFLGGFITIIMLSLFFKLCMVMQLGVSNNSSLYGSFIALPILLLWIYASWQIVLIGAEICYVHQYRHELLRESAFSHPSERDTIVVALAVVCKAAQSIEQNNGVLASALSVSDFANDFALPTREVLRIAALLEKHQLLLSVPDEDGNLGVNYVLNRDASRLKVCEIINACLDNTEGEGVLTRATDRDASQAVHALANRFTSVLAKEFSMTISQALKLSEDKVFETV